MFSSEKVRFQSNVYFSIDFGEKFQVSPGIGANVVQDLGWGVLINLGGSYSFEKWYPFIKGEYRVNGYEIERFNKNGDKYTSVEGINFLVLHAGVLFPMSW